MVSPVFCFSSPPVNYILRKKILKVNGLLARHPQRRVVGDNFVTSIFVQLLLLTSHLDLLLVSWRAAQLAPHVL